MTLDAIRKTVKEGKNRELHIYGRKYPDFRFQCPYCGSLEVLVAWKSTSCLLNGQCLECNNDWAEGTRV